MNILIVGGSGGIGLSLVRCFLDNYPNAEVKATFNSNCPTYKHERLAWIKLNIKNELEIEALANETGSVDILINAVGLLHSPEHKPEKSIRQLDSDFFNENIAINTLSSILLAKHFMKSLQSENNTYFVILSAKIGSIDDNRLGGWLSYRTSKAALNMAIKTVGIEWKHKVPNCCIILFHPGTTDTNLSKPFQSRLPKGQLHSADVTSEALLEIIKKSEPSESAKFISFDGSIISW